ncbi:MAG: S1 RNA-binding domain-containing protein [Candidatus Aminicenantes bacterium]|nr:S1 RNA-binding domain-containing protein [Candidatus Aminicenantes bacterium]
MSIKTKENEHESSENGQEQEASFEEMLAASFKPAPEIRVGDRVEAMVVAIDHDNIYLDMGTRVEGFVSSGEFTEGGELQVKEGQTIPVYVAGKRHGAIQCKRHLGAAETGSQDIRDESVYYALKEAYENAFIVEGKVKGEQKSGFEVTVMGQKAFCPISQIERGYCQNQAAHINKVYTFKIIEFGEEGKNIVLSRKEVLLDEEEKKAEKLWQEVELGSIREGVVTSIPKFGAFVNIGGIEGLLHVSEISYERIDDVSKVLKEGQTLEVEIISIDRVKRKIGFSLKTRLEDPWTRAMKELSVGKEIKGKVMSIKPYGAFVEVLPGLQGLLHVSRLGGERRHGHPKEVLRPGDMIKIRVLEIEKERKRISLTMEEPEIDYQSDIKKLQGKQEQQEKDSKENHMSGLIDAAVDKKEEQS